MRKQQSGQAVILLVIIAALIGVAAVFLFYTRDNTSDPPIPDPPGDEDPCIINPANCNPPDPNPTVITIEEELMAFSAGYHGTTACIAADPSNGICAELTNFAQSKLTTVSFFPTGTYTIRVRQMADSDGVDSADLSTGGLLRDTWQTSQGGNVWVDRIIPNVSITEGDTIEFVCTRSNQSTRCVIDFLEFTRIE